jgi:hypothetical protein
MIRRAREGFLKISFLAALTFTAAPAGADELLTGALRDQDGAVVAGARVDALDTSGRPVAHDRSAADGTFAVSAAVRPAVLIVRADNSDPLRIVVPAQGPVTAVVPRHRAADRVPSAADVAALPAGSVAELGTVVPYRIAFPDLLGDRWLARGRGVTTIEGLPFYRRADGADGSGLLPSHATGGITARDPLDALFYGDRAGGGVIDAQLFDRADTTRATSGDASLLIGRGTALLAATSWDPDGERRVAAARAAGNLGPLAGSVVALTGDLPGGHYAGIGADLRGASRALGVHVALAATRDVGDAIPDTGSVVSLVADAGAPGPNALAVRARWRDERGVLDGLAADHRDAALVIGTSRGGDGATRFTAALALTYGSDSGYTPAPQHALALLPSLSADAPLDRRWSLHAGLGDSTLGTPGAAIARASLGEVGLAFNDRRRLHFDFLVYAEGDQTPAAMTRGFAGDIGWEVAPRLSLRAWSLRDSDVQQTYRSEYPGGPPTDIVSVARPFRRDLVWLTWDAPVRVDLLLRAGALEGNLRVPLGGRYTLTLGSARRLVTGKRELTVGLVGR